MDPQTKTARDVANALIGERIRARRKALRLTQTDLAERLGLTFQQVQKYERGHNRLGAALLGDVCRALDVDVLYFLGDLAGGNGDRGGGAREDVCVVPRAAMEELLAAARHVDELLRGGGERVVEGEWGRLSGRRVGVG